MPSVGRVGFSSQRAGACCQGCLKTREQRQFSAVGGAEWGWRHGVRGEEGVEGVEGEGGETGLGWVGWRFFPGPARQGLRASPGLGLRWGGAWKRRKGAGGRRAQGRGSRAGRAQGASGAASLDPLGALGRGGRRPRGELAAALGRQAGCSLGVGGGPLVRRAGLGRLVLALDELAGAGVGQDEASGQAGVEDHDEQDVEIGVVALGAGRLAAHERVGHDPHAHARAGTSGQAAGVAPVVQLEQQAAEEGAQPLALAAVHGCRGVARRLQDAADLSPGARGSG